MMNLVESELAGRLTRFAGQHRRKLWGSGAVIAVYTLLGFFLLPWLVQKMAVDTVRERYGTELTIKRVAFNPYVLSLRIDGLSMLDPAGQPFVGAEQIYANLQLSSLFRLAPTFAEIRFDAPVAHLARAHDGDLNMSFLVQPSNTLAAPEAESSGPPRLIVHEFAVNDAALHWADAVPSEPVETTFGPVNVAIRNLNTLPQREGQQDVVITTDTAGTFSWSGTLQLNPLRSAGRAQLLGSHMQLVSAYIRDATGFELLEGNANVGFDYALDTESDGAVRAHIDNFELSLDEVLVRTFGRMSPAGEPADRDVLAIPALKVRGGTLHWPEQSVTIDDVAISSAEISIYRDVAGKLNIVPQAATTDTAAQPDTPVEDSGDNWDMQLSRFSINGMSIDLIDDSLKPQAGVGIADLTMSIADISLVTGARFPTEASIVTRGGGKVRINGEIGVEPGPVAELSILASELALAETHPYLKPLADVNLDSGQLGFDAKVSISPDEPFSFAGDVAITDFLITETDEGSRLGSWDRLAFENVKASVGARKIEVSELRFERPYADIFVAADGSVNLGRVEPGEQLPENDETDEPGPGEPERSAVDEETKNPFEITIGRVIIADAAADFADFSLPLPFEAGIAELNGSLTTIATASSEPSEIDMEGKVDEFGLLRVSGSITPHDAAKNTDIKLRFENVGVPKFSAYTVPFAGREIASGKLDLDLGYVLQDGELIGENRIVLRDFMLGDKVEHPGAMSLPLGLAVALLKGPDGSIDIDLPVRGNVNDPDFRYGRVIGKALVNLIVKIVASPFALLGKLVGAEADELDHIAFVAGRSDLTPPEQERIAKIAEALELRPELVLEVSGVVARETDGQALRTAKFDEQVEARIGTADEGDSMYAEQRADVIETLFQESATEGPGLLDELKAGFTMTTTDPNSGNVLSDFDSLAFTAELRRRLIELQSVAEEEFVALAAARASNVRAALAESSMSLAERIRLGRPQAVIAEDDGSVRMNVVLASGDE